MIDREGVELQILALTAVNLNKKYLDCVPFFIEYWTSFQSTNKEIEYVPKVLVMANEMPLQLEPYSKWCELIELDPRISSTFGSQAIRILQPALERIDYVLTTDVDMLPLDDRVFQAGIAQLAVGYDFVVCRDVLKNNQYPICYNIATPRTWAEITGVRSQIDVEQRLLNLFEGVGQDNNYRGDHGGVGWFADQEALYSMIGVFEKNGGRVAKLKDKETKHRRLDRLFVPFPFNWLYIGAVSRGKFTDYHVHHPVAKYFRFIRRVMISRGKRSGSKII
jgi:hypothetical protein